MFLRRTRWTLTGDPYEHAARGFDLTAPTYDRVEGANQLSERVRRVARDAALDVFRPGDRILELGCGTGRDATFFAARGIRVLATDVSSEMIARTRSRALEMGVDGLVEAKVAPALAAAKLGGPFDGVYSNGAVLNMEPGLRSVARDLAINLRAGGHAVFTFANRISLFELCFYPLVLRPRKAFRKLGAVVPIPVSREGPGRRFVVPTAFLSAKEFVGVWPAEFEVIRRRSLQTITPPWNLVREAERFPGVLAVLERFEDRLGERRGVRDLGAILLFVLRRRETAR